MVLLLFLVVMEFISNLVFQMLGNLFSAPPNHE